MTTTILRTASDLYELSKSILDLALRKPKKVTIETYDQRSADQNAQQWPYLAAFSQQIEYYGKKLTDESWKDLLTASYREEKIEMVPTLSGKNMVMLGLRTSKIPADEWGEWMEFLRWAAADQGVKVPISKKMEARYGY